MSSRKHKCLQDISTRHLRRLSSNISKRSAVSTPNSERSEVFFPNFMQPAVSTPNQSSLNPTVMQPIEDCGRCGCHLDKDFKNKIENDLDQIKRELKLVLQMLREQRGPAIDNENNDVHNDFDERILPMRTEEDIQIMEKRLRNEEEKKKMISFLAHIGGHEINTIVKNILRKLLSDAISSTYNWEGKKGKKMFSSLILSECIRKAAILSPNAKGTITEQDVITSIKNWLRHASARSSGSIHTPNSNNMVKIEAIEMKEQFFDDENGIPERQTKIENSHSNQTTNASFKMEEVNGEESSISEYNSNQENNFSDIKCGDVDIVEQFVNQNGIYNRETFFIKNEINDQENKAPSVVKTISTEETNNFNIQDPNSDKESSTTCQLCQYVSKSEEEMQVHINSAHSKQEKLSDFLCETVANCESNLTSKKHQCDFCGYTAAQKSTLQLHIQSVHLKIKKHQCNFCDFSSTFKGNLNRHIESIHTNQEKFKCHLCPYDADLKKNLDIHIKSIHLNIKKYRCHICKFATAKKIVLKRHVQGVHSKRKRPV